ncbi:MAG: hypothetical protein ABGX83_05250 [Nitrospira sp.]
MSLSLSVNKVDRGIVTNIGSDKVVFATGRNIRCHPGELYKNPGKRLLNTTPNTVPVRAIYSFKGHDNVMRSIVCSDSKIFSYTGGMTAVQDITPTPAPTGTSHAWRFTTIGGQLVISNNVDPMWKWPAYASPLVTLPNAPNRVGTLGTLKNRLITADVLDNNFSYPARVKMSGINAPEIFTIDRKMRADQQDLLDHRGQSDAVEKVMGIGYAGSRIRMYTERNIYFIDSADLPYHFIIDIGHEGIGLYGKRTLVSVKGVDYFMGPEDFYVLSGDRGPRPIGFPIRNACFDNLNKDVGAIDQAFTFYQPITRDIFFCVATGTSLVADTAFVYNLESKGWTICDVDYSCFSDSRQDQAVGGGYGTGGYGEGPYGGGSGINILPYVIVGNTKGEILALDDGTDNNGKAVTGYVETGDHFGSSALLKKVTHALMPIMNNEATDEPVLVQVGSRKALSDKIKWSRPKPFLIGTDKRVKIVNRGEFFRFRFYTDQLNSPWRLFQYKAFYSEETLR